MAQPEQPVQPPVPDPQSEVVQQEVVQPQPEQATEGSGTQVPAGTQVSEAAGVPQISQDAYGNPVNIRLDPVTGAPMEEGGAQ